MKIKPNPRQTIRFLSILMAGVLISTINLSATQVFAQSVTVSMQLDIFGGRLSVAQGQVTISGAANARQLNATLSSVGLLDAVFPFYSTLHVQFAGQKAWHSQRYQVMNETDDERKSMTLTYARNKPVRIALRGGDAARTPVPPEQLLWTNPVHVALQQSMPADVPHTRPKNIATLSGQRRTHSFFDGKRGMQASVSCPRIDWLDQHKHLDYAGPAIYCQLELKQLSGFRLKQKYTLQTTSSIELWLVPVSWLGLKQERWWLPLKL